MLAEISFLDPKGPEISFLESKIKKLGMRAYNCNLSAEKKKTGSAGQPA